MEASKAQLIGQRGLRLMSTSFEPSGACRGAVVLVHGIGEHSGRYRHVIAALVEQGYAVYTLDHRGHGESEGLRAHVEHFDYFVDDLHLLVEQARVRHPELPLFMLGQSLGGLIATRYALSFANRLAGLVVCAPALHVGDDAPPLLKRLARVIATLAPRLPVVSSTNAVLPLSRDPLVQEMLDADPLVYKGKVRARMGYEIVRAAADALRRVEALTLPILIMHGTDDRVTNPSGSQAMYERVRSADKTLKLWPDARHEIFNELNKDAVIAFLTAWLDDRTAGDGAAANALPHPEVAASGAM